MSVHDYNTTPSSNATIGGTNIAEGCSPAGLNDAIRTLMADVRKMSNDFSGGQATTGSSNAYAVVSSSTWASYDDGRRISIRANHTNTGAATVDVDSLGTRAIKKYSRVGVEDVGSGDIQANGIYDLTYESAGGYFVLTGSLGTVLDFASRADAVSWGKTPAVGTVIRADGMAWIYDGTSTDIVDMSGFAPVEPITPNHYLDNTTPGTTDMRLAFQRANSRTCVLSLRNEEYYLGATFTVLNPLVFNHGSSLHAADGVTVTLSEDFTVNTTDQIFQWTGTGAFSLSAKTEIPIEWFGGVADGSTTNTAAHDKAMAALDRGYILYGNGTYRFNTATASETNGRKGIKGLGRGMTILQRGSFTTGHMFTFEAADITAAKLREPHMSGVWMEGDDTVTYTGGGFIHVKGATGGVFEDIRTINGHGGILITSCQNMRIRGCDFETDANLTHTSGIGIDIQEDQTAVKRENANLFLENTTVKSPASSTQTDKYEKAIRIGSSDGVYINDCYFGNALDNGMEITPQYADSQLTGIKVSGNTWFDPVRSTSANSFGEGTNIHIHGDTSSAAGGFQFTGCQVNGGTASWNNLAIDTTGAETFDRVTFVNCNFQNARDRSVHVRNTGSGVGPARFHFVGNTVVNGSLDGTVPAVTLDGTEHVVSQNNIGSGGTVGSDPTTSNFTYAIVISAGLTNSTIADNLLIGGSQEEPISDASSVTANNIIMNNNMGTQPKRRPIYVEDFGAKGDNSRDCTTAIQAAINYAEAVAHAGGAVLNKAGIGGEVRFGSGVFQISSQLTINSDGVYLVGEGEGTTIIRQTDETENGIVMKTVNTLTDANADRPGNVGVKNLSIYIAASDQTDSLSGYGIVAQLVQFKCEGVNVRGFRRSFHVSGSLRGSRITDCISECDRGGTIAVQATDDCHIYVGGERVSSGGNLASDGNRYENSTGLYIDNFQSHCPDSIKMAYGLWIGHADGVYATNSHFGFCDESAVCLQSQVGDLVVHNVIVDGCFLDINDTTNWGIKLLEPSSGSSAVNQVLFSNLRGNIGAEGFAQVDVASAANIRFDGFSLNSRDGATGTRGFDIVDGNDISIVNGNISSCPSGYYIYVTNLTGGGGGADRVEISNIHMRDYSASPGGDATAGIYVDRQSTGLSIENCRIYDCNSNPIDVQGASAGSRDWQCRNILHDASYDVASASMLPTPLWTDFINVTGTTNITGLVRTGTGFGQFNGRIVTLKFAGALTITHTDEATANQNIYLSGSTNYTTAAGDVLTLKHYNGYWYEISRTTA